MPKAAQPNLNYIGLSKVRTFKIMKLCVSAPEIQHKATCTTASDMYSLGMVFIACFNSGHSVIQASHSTQQYFKLAGQVRDQCQFWTDLDIYSQLSERVNSVLAKIPIGIQESVFHLVNQDTRHRPTARSLVQISYFGWDYNDLRVCELRVIAGTQQFKPYSF